MVDTEIVETALAELDEIFGSRDRTWEILLDRFIGLTMEGQFTACALADRDFNKKLWLWVKWRRALRKVRGYMIVKGRDPMTFLGDDEQQAIIDYDAQPEKITKVLGPEDRDERLRAVRERFKKVKGKK